MPFVIPTIFTAIDKFSNPVKGMGKALGDFKTSADKAAKSINESFDKAGKAASRGVKSALAGAAIASPLIYAAKAAIDFEDNMTGVAKTTGLAGTELETYAKGILEIAKHTRTSIPDLQKIGEVGGRLGVSGKDILAFTDASNKFAVALGSDYGGGVEEAISQVGKIKNVFKELRAVPIAESITRAGSAINDLTSIGATAENINDFVLRVGTIPDAIKPSFVQVAALGAFLEKVGIDSQIGASGFSELLLVGSRNLPTFAKQMKISTKAATELFNTDPLAFAVKFSGSLNKLKGDQLGIKLKGFKIESKEALKVVGVLGKGTDLLGQAVNTASSAYDKGISLQNEYNKVNNTTAGKLAQAKNNFEILAITIGTKLLPHLQPLIDKFITFIDKVGAWIDKNPKAVAAIEKITIGLAGMALVISGVNFLIAGYNAVVGIMKVVTFGAAIAMNLYNFAMGIMAVVTGTSTGLLIGNKVAMLGVQFATNIATAAQWLFNASLFGCPIVWIIAGIIALIAIIVIVTKKWDSWGAAVSLMLGPLGLIIGMFKAFARNWEIIKKGFQTDGILGGLKAIGATLLDVILMPLQQILEIIGKIPGKVGELGRSGAASIEQFRRNIGVNVGDQTAESAPVAAVNPKLVQQVSMNNTMQAAQGTVNGQITVNDNTGGKVTANNNSGSIPIVIKPNVGSWNKK